MDARARMTREVGRVLGCFACAAVAAWILAAGVAEAQVSYSVVYSFPGWTDAGGPHAPLLQATDGNFYGTTVSGGTSGYGTVFKLTPGGTLTTLHSFTWADGDGANPYAGLLQATDGNFYGTTPEGGTSGGGIVFKLTPGGTFTTLHAFTGGADGANPYAALLQAADGNFYGTTTDEKTPGLGTIFRLTPGGTFTTLYTFTGGADGDFPGGPLIQATDGNFYGTTGGGTSARGTIFQLTPAGTHTTLYTFTGGADGAYPLGSLLQATDGNFYGTTSRGGTSDRGTIFRLTPGGTFTTLHAFAGGADGDFPYAGLLQATDGNFYGTTSGIDTSGLGTIFRLTPGGTFTTLHAFTRGADGASPYAGLIQATDGNLYGTTRLGGTSDAGTVFTLSFPLAFASLTPDQASPQPTGTPVTFTATATGGVAPYQYKWWVFNGTKWSVGQEWGTSNTFAWTPSAVGSYLLQVWARNSGSTADTAEAYQQIAYTITAPPLLSVTSLTATPASPQVDGTPVTFTATATGGVAPVQYKWWIGYGCALGGMVAHVCWDVLQDWGTSPTVVWRAWQGLFAQRIQVWARSGGNTADAAEAYKEIIYTVTRNVPTVTSLTADQAAPQPIGTPITFTATATGGVAPVQYKWWVYNGTTWSVGQAWSTGNTFAWTPTAPGSYLLQVWARNSGSTADTAEGYKQVSYTVTAPPPLTVTGVTPDKAAPQLPGTTVTFTATASGGVAPYQYKWWGLYRCPGGIGAAIDCWVVDQDWGTSNTFTLTGRTERSYTFQVWARSNGSTADTAEAYRQFSYTWTLPPPLSVTSLTADKTSPQPTGTAITFTATATSGVAPYQYKWWVYNGTTWSVGQEWGTNTTFAWTPTAPGSYLLQVWARNSGTTTDTPEAYGQLAYMVSPPPPLSVPSLTADKTSPQPLGAPVTFTATATGGVAPYQYKWWVFNGSTWSNPQNWSPTSTFSWTPTTAGTYEIQVWARNNGVTADTPQAYARMAYTITLTNRTVALVADKASPQTGGTTITFTATAANGTAPYQYKWFVAEYGYWRAVQDWNTAATFAWTWFWPGNYGILVWVRSDGNAADEPEAYAQMVYVTLPPGLDAEGLPDLHYRSVGDWRIRWPNHREQIARC